MNVDLQNRIPNNVGLEEDRKLQRALESWQPAYVDWWRELGPVGFQEDEIYLRTAVSVEPNGWAKFDYVRMPEYRWGIFLTPIEDDRTVPFGDNFGEKAWDEVPGDWRSELRRIIVTQGDTEPASVEQQRLLGKTAPSLYDLRNLFQVNVEEGRHLWAMVYLLHKYFGRDGREEADDMLLRHSGDVDAPRILAAFNEPVEDWLSFFCFTMFTDRDGKFQLAALAESGFNPLARSCRFMLTEEAHHLFVGETGIERVIRRTCELMKEAPEEDVTKLGGIPLDIIQKYINRWYSVCLDLFGGEDSSNSASYFSAGLKGRFRESSSPNIEEHVALEGSYVLPILSEVTGTMTNREIPLRRAMNQLLRDDYSADCARAVERWNRVIKASGVRYRLKLPSQLYNRGQGIYQGLPISTEGALLTTEQYASHHAESLPSDAELLYVASLMKPCFEVGQIASWISPPKRGVGGQGFDFEYARFEGDPYQR